MFLKFNKCCGDIGVMSPTIDFLNCLSQQETNFMLRLQCSPRR